MITALLLDLDDTLLDNPNSVFLPAYFKALAARLTGFLPPEQLLPALAGAATGEMLENDDPTRTLAKSSRAALRN